MAGGTVSGGAQRTNGGGGDLAGGRTTSPRRPTSERVCSALRSAQLPRPRSGHKTQSVGERRPLSGCPRLFGASTGKVNDCTWLSAPTDEKKISKRHSDRDSHTEDGSPGHRRRVGRPAAGRKPPCVIDIQCHCHCSEVIWCTEEASNFMKFFNRTRGDDVSMLAVLSAFGQSHRDRGQLPTVRGHVTQCVHRRHVGVLARVPGSAMGAPRRELLRGQSPQWEHGDAVHLQVINDHPPPLVRRHPGAAQPEVRRCRHPPDCLQTRGCVQLEMHPLGGRARGRRTKSTQSKPPSVRPSLRVRVSDPSPAFAIEARSALPMTVGPCPSICRRSSLAMSGDATAKRHRAHSSEGQSVTQRNVGAVEFSCIVFPRAECGV